MKRRAVQPTRPRRTTGRGGGRKAGSRPRTTRRSARAAPGAASPNDNAMQPNAVPSNTQGGGEWGPAKGRGRQPAPAGRHAATVIVTPAGGRGLPLPGRGRGMTWPRGGPPCQPALPARRDGWERGAGGCGRANNFALVTQVSARKSRKSKCGGRGGGTLPPSWRRKRWWWCCRPVHRALAAGTSKQADLAKPTANHQMY